MTQSEEDTENNSNDVTTHWIGGVKLCATASAVVFLLNTILIATAAGLAHRYPPDGDFTSSMIIFKGSCKLSDRLDLALHWVINALSTGILAASSYCMQTLVAPSREEIDAHHAQYQWLDIGSASVRNLFMIGRYRLTLWMVLLVTATPFHLLYNSIIFQSEAANEAVIVFGPKDLNSTNIWNLTTPSLEKCFGFDENSLSWPEFASNIAQRNYERLSPDQCKHLLLDESPRGAPKYLILLGDNVIASQRRDASILLSTGSFDYNRTNGPWTTNVVSFINKTLDAQGDDMICNYLTQGGGSEESVHFSECLGIEGEEHCQLRYNPPICIIVTLCLLIKVAAMFLAARISRYRTQPLLTVGDAVASFLKKADPMTEGLSLMSKADFCHGDWKNVHEALQNAKSSEDSYHSKFISHRQLTKPKRWMHAASIWRWLITLFLCCTCIALGVYCQLYEGPYNIPESFENLDAFPGTFTVSWYPGSRCIGTVVMANLPQILITTSYFSYNSVLTDMLAAAEYSSYGTISKPLRVTWPVKGSQQQSTYWLSVPYSYGFPMVIAHVVLHWLVSRSFYFVMPIPYDVHGNLDKDGMESTIVGSRPYVLLSMILVALILCFLVALSFKKFKSDIPLAGSCSAAISSACHPPSYENLDTIACGLVIWKETAEQPTGHPGTLNSQNRYCSFASAGTREP